MKEKVRLYRNLTNKCYSYMLRIPRLGWRVQGHTPSAYMENVRFLVYGSGRKRVLETGRKTVHAFIEGSFLGPTLVAPDDLTLNIWEIKRVRYNPKVNATFVDTDNKPVYGAEQVWVTPVGVFARGLRYEV